MTTAESANNDKSLKNTEFNPDQSETYLVFEMIGENTGLKASEVLSIVLVPELITRVPNAPFYVRGVMNLRGIIIPVLDCSVKIGGPPMELGPESRIVVADIEGIMFGVMVDAVREVRSVFQSQVEKPDPSRESALSVDHVSGIAKLDDGRLLVLLDLSTVFDLEELLAEDNE